jgi:two-component system invasion response regulator UvrY
MPGMPHEAQATDGLPRKDGTILLVDDHPIVRSGCRRLLEAFTVVESETAEQAFRLFHEHQIDMVILDLGLPDLGGIEVAQRLRAEDPGVRILVFSMYDDPIFAGRSLQAGALGYITKNDAPEDLVRAVELVLQGKVYLSNGMARELAVMNFAPSRSPLQSLSARERQVLTLLGKGKSIAEIGDELGISYKTVANTSTQIKDKLGVKTMRDLIRIAVEQRLGA